LLRLACCAASACKERSTPCLLAGLLLRPETPPALHLRACCAFLCLQSAAPSADSLRSVISHLKQQYGLQYVYMWHAMMGFWSGVAPGVAPGEGPTPSSSAAGNSSSDGSPAGSATGEDENSGSASANASGIGKYGAKVRAGMWRGSLPAIWF
jgi:hypothetical protein